MRCWYWSSDVCSSDLAFVYLLDSRTTDQLLAEGIGPIEKLYGNYGPGRYGWVLGNVRPLSEPIGCVGRQGFWTLPDDVADAVMTASHPPQITGEQCWPRTKQPFAPGLKAKSMTTEKSAEGRVGQGCV